MSDPGIDNISIAIPNWNGEDVLLGCLQSIQEAVNIAGLKRPVEIVIADDQSTDRSLEIVAEHYPAVRLIQMEERSGFGKTANLAVQQSSNDYVLLLNNDVTLDKEFFIHWSQHFEDPDVFALCSWMLRWDRKTVDSGKRVAMWDKGLIRHWVVQNRGKPSVSFYASGGASIYDRKKFLTVGGFDSLFRPMYTEDLDLSYVAWKRGWKVLYEPACMVYHHNSFSSDRVYNQRKKYLYDTKNHFLFVWKNITDPALFTRHLAWLPLRVAVAPFYGRRLLLAGFLVALRQLREAADRREEMKITGRINDRTIFDWIHPSPDDLKNSPYQGIPGAA